MLKPEPQTDHEAEYRRVKAESVVVKARVENYKAQADALRTKAKQAAEQADKMDVLANKEWLFLDHLECLLRDLQRRHYDAIGVRKPGRRLACDPPCGKKRFDSKDDANKGRQQVGPRLRAYYSFECRCWHLTKQAYHNR